jgi:pimeloyl-ACP methyl ester carboxylesterase
VRVPVLVTWGALEPIVPARWAAEVARLLPQGEIAVVPGSPHNCVYAGAEGLAAAVLPFLDRVLR